MQSDPPSRSQDPRPFTMIDGYSLSLSQGTGIATYARGLAHALKSIWGEPNYFNGRSMDVYIAKLRRHLSGDPSIEILNVHGKGFKLLAN